MRSEGKRLDDEAIANGDIVLLQPGPLPECTTSVHVHLWQPGRAKTRAIPQALCREWQEAAAYHRLPLEPLQEWLRGEDAGASGKPFSGWRGRASGASALRVLTSPPAHPPEDDEGGGQAIWHKELARRSECLLPLGKVQVRPTDPDDSLKQGVLRLPALAKEVGGALAPCRAPPTRRLTASSACRRRRRRPGRNGGAPAAPARAHRRLDPGARAASHGQGGEGARRAGRWSRGRPVPGVLAATAAL